MKFHWKIFEILVLGIDNVAKAIVDFKKNKHIFIFYHHIIKWLWVIIVYKPMTNNQL